MNGAWPITDPGLERRQRTGADHGRPPDQPGPPTAEQNVVAFLRANPDWLAGQPDLYRSLAPPVRLHGETLADHMAAMLQLERERARALAEQTAALLAAERGTAATLARVHEAVVGLVAARSPLEFVRSDLPHMLGADAACLTGGPAAGGTPLPDAAPWQALLGSSLVLFRRDPADAERFYAEAAPLALHDVLIRLPGFGVLGLAGRTPPLGEDAGRAGLRFLGCAIAAALLA